MAMASARFAAQPASRRTTVVARCSGPVPRSLRGANGVPELVEATRDAGRAALEDSSPALAGDAFAPKPRVAPSVSVAVLAAPSSTVALAASPALNSAVLPALVTAAAVRPHFLQSYCTALFELPRLRAVRAADARAPPAAGERGAAAVAAQQRDALVGAPQAPCARLPHSRASAWLPRCSPRCRAPCSRAHAPAPRLIELGARRGHRV